MRLGRWEVDAACISFLGCVAACLFSTPAVAEPLEICRAGKPHAYLVCPKLQGPTRKIVSNTINGFLLRSYGWELPPARDTASPGIYLVVGNPENNAVLRELVAKGLQLDDAALVCLRLTPFVAQGFAVQL